MGRQELDKLIRVATATVGIAIAASVALRAGDQSRADLPGLILELICDASDATGPGLRATVRNTGLEDTAIVLGITLANGKVYLPTSVTLRVRRPPSEDEEELSYGHPEHAVFSGRLDPWVVPLPRGSSYTLSIPASHFHSTKTPFKTLEITEQPLEMRLALDARPIGRVSNDMAGLRCLRLWAGTLASHAVRAPIDCSRAHE